MRASLLSAQKKKVGCWLLLSLLAAAGCRREGEPPGPSGADYYPLAVGDFRVYDVVDTTWRLSARPTAIERYQLRERVDEEFTDAGGKTAFRVVRSKRLTAADAWRDDSVLVVSPTATNVVVTAFNRRTVELVFPVRENYEWDRDAFATTSPSSAVTRQFVDVGKPFALTWGGQTLDYPTTATVYDKGFDPSCIPNWRRQVYAKGKGPVYRQFRSLSLDRNGTCVPATEYISFGRSRTEVLREQGRM